MTLVINVCACGHGPGDHASTGHVGEITGHCKICGPGGCFEFIPQPLTEPKETTMSEVGTKAQVNGEWLDHWDLGVMQHTALRKRCESDPTTAAYSIIGASECDEGKVGAWGMFLQKQFQGLCRGIIPGKSLAEMTQWHLQHFAHGTPLASPFDIKRVDRDKMLDREIKLYYALEALFRMYSADDWQGQLSYLFE